MQNITFNVTILLKKGNYGLMISKNRIKYIHSLSLKKNRKADGVFVAEGHKLVGDIVSHFVCEYIAATSEWLTANQDVIAHCRSGNEHFSFDEVTNEELTRVSFVDTPQQVLAVFRAEESSVTLSDAAKSNLCIMLDDVQNPGNLGTIVRLADWFGIEHIFCSQGCADIYNPKTIQATMGAIARVRVHYINIIDELSQFPSGIPVYGTFLDGDNIYNCELSANGVIVMGNEGNGVSSDVAQKVSHRLFIPPYPQGRQTSESLNVAIATSIVCAEFRRRCK